MSTNPPPSNVEVLQCSQELAETICRLNTACLPVFLQRPLCDLISGSLIAWPIKAKVFLGDAATPTGRP
jgi:hypothetical protein